MRTMKKILPLLLLAAGAAFAAPALANGHVRFGISIGVPIWGPGYYYPPPYYYAPYSYYPPATVVVPAQPQRYIEQAPQASADSFWYYCADAKAYYPYVKDCPAGWQRVSPTPR